VFLKLRDKKSKVHNSAFETLETFQKYSYSITDVSDDYITNIKEKHPELNVRVMKIIEKFFLNNLNNKNKIN